jgi:hypothetical protein
VVILSILVIGGVVIASAIYANKQAAARREALAALASELGWNFDPSQNPSHDEEFRQFPCFQRGHSRSAYNTLLGTIAIKPGGETADASAPPLSFPARMGDFTYKVTTSNGKSTTTTTYRFSYLIVQLPWSAARVPSLLIRAEGLMDKLAGALGFDDIDFESEEFSRRFCVKSPDKKFAYDVCDPRMMEFLLHSSPPPIDLQLGQCCLTDGRRRLEPAQFRMLLEWTRAFFERWPEHVIRDLATDR